MVCLLAFGGSAMAQKNTKIGHINSNDLMQIMPGRDSAQTVLQGEVAELEETLKSMQAEAEKRIEEFQQSAQKQLQEREAELLKPIIDRAKKAIADVAKEGGYTYIFDAGTAAILYDEGGDDIMPLVKKKLGLK